MSVILTQLFSNREVYKKNILHDLIEFSIACCLFSGAIIDCNDGFCRLTGLDKREILEKKSIYNFFSEEEAFFIENELAIKENNYSLVKENIKFISGINRYFICKIKLIKIDKNRFDLIVISQSIGSSGTDVQDASYLANHFRALTSVSLDAIISVSLDGQIMSWNRGAEIMFGFAASEAIGKNFHRLLPPVNLTDPVIGLAFSQATQLTSLEVLRLRRDKTEIRLAMTIGPIRDDRHRIYAYSIVARDITQNYRLEKALYQTEAFTRSILESSPDFITVLDLDGDVTFINAAAMKALEVVNLSHLRKQNWKDIWPMRAQGFLRDAIANALQGKSGRGEIYCPSGFGQPRWWDVIVSPVVDSSGKLTQTIIASRDITARRQAEEARTLSQERLGRAANVAGLTYVEISPDRTHCVVAENFHLVTGLVEPSPSGAVLLDSVLNVLLAHTAEGDKFELETALGGILRGQGEGKVEFRLRSAKGAVTWIELEWTRRSGAGAGQVFATFRNVTRRKMAEDQLKLLISEINHRAKNLLGVVQAIARQTARHTKDPSQFIRYLSDRIASLSAGLDLLVRNEWRGVYLHELIEAQLSHFKAVMGTRVQLYGADLRISPTAAQNIGMALNELATNAGKYGALSNSDGQILIEWAIEMRNTPVFRMRWSEKGGPPVRTPTRSGFGKMVLQGLVHGAVGGYANIYYYESGLVWELEAPAHKCIDTAEKI